MMLIGIIGIWGCDERVQLGRVSAECMPCFVFFFLGLVFWHVPICVVSIRSILVVIRRVLRRCCH
jgi:hypothetical protein